MVQFKGININIVSQFDAKPLPEHSTARAFDASGTVVACYIPVYAGAQIWLEYSIDGPHPPKAAYFFKMLVNGQVVTRWDCTAKHEYQGKTVYLLQTVRPNPRRPLVVLQKSMTFGSTKGDQSPNAEDDCIEIRVHRIEHRRRIRELPLDDPLPKQSRGQETLRLKDHGPIEPYRPARKYQYQLLDPHDDPYANFRFYCRTQDYLERHQLIDPDGPLSPASPATSTSHCFDAKTSPKGRDRSVEPEQKEPSTPTKHVIHELSASTKDSPVSPKHLSRSPIRIYSPRKEKTPSIKGSVEDLRSKVPRSPQSPKRIKFHKSKQEDTPLSPTQPSSLLLPEPLRVKKPCIPRKEIVPLASVPDPPTPSPEKSPIKSSIYRTLPLRQSSLPSPPPTASPRPIRLPYQRHKPSHLNLNPNQGYSPDLKFKHGPDLDLKLNVSSPLSKNSSNNTTPCQVPREPPTTPTTAHRPLSPFTPSGLLRRFSSASSLPCRRPSTPTPLVPTVQEVDTAVRLHNEKRKSILGSRIEKTNDESDITPVITPRTLRRMRSAGFLHGLFAKKGERRVISHSPS